METLTVNQNTEVNSTKEIINKVILTGFLGQDPKVDVLASKMKVAKFSVATNYQYKNSKGEMVKETQWHNIVAFAKLASEVEAKLKKGTRVTVEGRISYNIFTDKAGVKKQYTDIIASEFAMHQKKEA
ncbi:MAG: single-stranded DNA-binding protein [Bacteroidia bacterium]|nr:single-stranded DNA-binding protein [Bacteroidia bacterium]